jgi:peptide/nickel transport system ATP-binding protein
MCCCGKAKAGCAAVAALRREGTIMGSIRFNKVDKVFGPSTGGVKALDNINLEIGEKEFVAIVGPSGCGKTTCLRMVAGFEAPSAGVVSVSGKPVTSPGPDRAVVFQQFALFPWKSVRANIELGLRNKGLPTGERADLVAGALKLMNLESHAEAFPHQLSGGMRQRAMIAMAISCEPKFLIADEPTTALDVTIQAQILELFQNLQEKLNMTVQFITHDLGVISEITDRVLVMYGGQMCETAPTDVLFKESRHPYTRALISSRPKFGHRVNRLSTIEGSVPAPHELPAGCPFTNRCSRATSQCAQQKPNFVDVGQNHKVACFHPLEN